MLKKIFSLFTALFLSVSILAPFLVKAFVPSDPLYGYQTYFKQINIEPAWDLSKGDGVVVAVLDSGVNIDHPDLKDNIWTNPGEIAGDGIDNDNNGYIDDVYGWDFIGNTSDPRMSTGTGEGVDHGTAVAGLIGAVADNGISMAGAAFKSKIMPLKVLGVNGEGDVTNLVKAIKYAVDNKADIINLSLIGKDYSAELQDAIKYAKDRGVLVVAAAGNSGSDLDQTKEYPVCYGNKTDNLLLLGVASVDDNNIKASFSNYGLNCVGISAPGAGLLSLSSADLTNQNFYQSWSGTSLSTALVSGVAALVKSRNPNLTPAGIISIIAETADSVEAKNPSFGGKLGAGLINAAKAVEVAIIPIEGRLVKTNDYPAVYFVDGQNQRHLFSTENTYWSWYNGIWKDQPIQVISQNEFDNLKVGQNVLIRPGSNLVEFDNSREVYAMEANSSLCKLDKSTISDIYGADWSGRLAVVQSGFEANYAKDQSCPLASGPKYQNGSLIQYAGSEDFWYLDNNAKRNVTGDGFLANSFEQRFVIRNVNPDNIYAVGPILTSWEKLIFPYSLQE